MATANIQVRTDEHDEFTHHFHPVDGSPNLVAQRWAYLNSMFDSGPAHVNICVSGPAAEVVAWVDNLAAYAHQQLAEPVPSTGTFDPLPDLLDAARDAIEAVERYLAAFNRLAPCFAADEITLIDPFDLLAEREALDEAVARLAHAASLPLAAQKAQAQ